LLSLARDLNVAWRETLAAANTSGERSFRNAEWCLRKSAPTSSETNPEPIELTGNADSSFELFVRPDDRYEANNVASLCSEEVAELSEALEANARHLS
jgi:hypothetical protein